MSDTAWSWAIGARGQLSLGVLNQPQFTALGFNSDHSSSKISNLQTKYEVPAFMHRESRHTRQAGLHPNPHAAWCCYIRNSICNVPEWRFPSSQDQVGLQQGHRRVGAVASPVPTSPVYLTDLACTFPAQLASVSALITLISTSSSPERHSVVSRAMSVPIRSIQSIRFLHLFWRSSNQQSHFTRLQRNTFFPTKIQHSFLVPIKHSVNFFDCYMAIEQDAKIQATKQ